MMDGSLALRSSRCPTIAPSRGRIAPSGRAGKSYFLLDQGDQGNPGKLWY